jgi:hypothetical protein
MVHALINNVDNIFLGAELSDWRSVGLLKKHVDRVWVDEIGEVLTP